MTGKDVEAHAQQALDRLKDFQRATVDSLYQSLFCSDRRRMLVADEVGLGKTIVARGLIARVLQERMEEGKRKPFTVTYICSNQIIAHENLKKLNLFAQDQISYNPISRIIEVALDKEDREQPSGIRALNLNTLTPATSFQVSQSTGLKRERSIIYALLTRDLRMRNRKNGLLWVLKSGVRRRNIDRLRDYFEWQAEQPLQEGLPAEFISELKATILNPDQFQSIYEQLGARVERSLYDAVIDIAERIDGRNERTLHGACYSLTVEMRRVLIRCCLKYVNADLYILDEFQRFRDLIDPNLEDEATQIARRLFSKKDTRILLLSATPFKAFTAAADIDQGEDHYRDFSKVLEFVLDGDQEALSEYETHRQALYQQIVNLKRGRMDLDPTHRQAIERTLRRAMCRTERHQVCTDPNALLEDCWKQDTFPFSTGDIQNFLLTDRMTQSLDRIGIRTQSPIEYAKSALCPLSFMDRYKVKEVLKQKKNTKEVARALDAHQEGWIDFTGIKNYQWKPGEESAGPANARLRQLIDKSVGTHGAQLLWVPPSMPYYPMEGPYAGSEGFTKTLLFSSWVMVPRMVASLVSYEVERRTIGDPRTLETQERAGRVYFTPEGGRRSPIPQLTYARRYEDGKSSLSNMSNFTLLYPSRSLMEIVRPVENLNEGKQLAELKQEAARRIKERLTEAGLEQYETPQGESERWYWAAPLLLDRCDPRYSDVVEKWFEGDEGWPDRPAWFSDEGEKSTAKNDHFELFRDCFDDPQSAGLGKMPEDLPEVLADLAFGSPAVLALRGFVRLFPQETKSARMVGSFDAADNLITLFNKPEAIAAIRLAYPNSPHPYWRMVAHYCADGCLQAVLEEYFHLLKGQAVDTQSAISQLLEAITLTSASINVDSYESFKSGKPGKMRCHYAVEFGSQKIETEDGKNRAINLRQVFNSPFRPFVLATTSIGQEGLDFHSYCRRIVHWNLPSNPVDLEQREGRINRYKGLVIRQHIAQKYGGQLLQNRATLDRDIWDQLFELADQLERKDQDRCELVPYWHVDASDVKIERVVPMYPFSRDQARLETILRTLALYRLAFGQPRQAELVDHLLDRNFTQEELREITSSLMIDLSPISWNNQLKLAGKKS
jgi:hypothetical protein